MSHPYETEGPVETEFEFAALCPAGFEGSLATELKDLGAHRVRALKGSVSFFGDLVVGYSVSLWSRLASRILLILGRFDVANYDDLYDVVLAFPWENHIGPKATIATEARGSNDEIHDLRFATLRVKDGICDRLCEVRSSRPYVDSHHPDVRIVATIRAKRTSLSLDFAGSGLIDHGGRVSRAKTAAQPHGSFVREDMANLICMVGGWDKICRHNSRACLFDPLGTSPSLVGAAAGIAADRAPRLTRNYWGFSAWMGHDEKAWKRITDDARLRFEKGCSCGVRVRVACVDPATRIELSEMARKTGLDTLIEVQACGPGVMDVGAERLSEPLIACVLPEKGSDTFAGDLATRLAALRVLSNEALAEADIVALSASNLLQNTLGRDPEVICNVINGNADASISVFASSARVKRAEAALVEGEQIPNFLAATTSLSTIRLPGSQEELAVLVPTSDQFAARLYKNAKTIGSWARRERISCYRVYDADLPDYAVSIDLYEGAAPTPGKRLVVSEYAPPSHIDAGLARRRLTDVLSIASRILEVDDSRMFLKVRRRSKGGAQYATHYDEGQCGLVEEGNLIFEVNFSDYLDTGLFLDHRLVRSLIEQRSARARFLNLFAYTATATCYAARGGAYQTTTVDLSNTYLAWARRNMEQNGFSGPMHEYFQDDALAWIDRERHSAHRWDLIYVDPPTFSNSARMKNAEFDVQRDHAELIISASRLLTRTGTLIFSCNFRNFKLDYAKLNKIGIEIEDISSQTLPYDFERSARIHHCYVMHRIR